MMTSQQSHGDQMTLDDLDLTVREVRTPEDLLGLQGLILPGGESTTMSLFLDRNEFYDALKNWLSGKYGEMNGGGGGWRGGGDLVKKW